MANLRTNFAMSAEERKLLQGFSAEVEKGRKQRKWSLRALARAADVSHIAILRIERGEVVPSLLCAFRVANALGIDLGKL